MLNIIAHRGASAIAPENTIPAFKKAIEQGANGIELDVHLSADGYLVVIHDEDIMRTAGVKGLIPEMNITQIKKIKVPNGFKDYGNAEIPLLQEVYELIRPTGLTINVEIKNNKYVYPGIEKKLLHLERDMGMKGRILYSSFNHHTLKRLTEISKTAPTGVLYTNMMVNPWHYAKHIGAIALHPYYEILFNYPNYVQTAHSNNIMVNTWTVDDPHIVRELYKRGVDVIMTNKPYEARSALL